ncbi:MAG: NAD(P)-dependent oxidoreductase [Verrucomicrobia bacterium]|nr:NAD(P)-dependent oxidoreductase [Verrucomicrobiota bacterium]
MKTVLITGGTGFLGSNLIGQLIRNCRVINLVRSSSDCFRIDGYSENITLYNLDEVNLADIFAREDIDTIIHCATNYGRRENDTFSLLEANLMLPLKLLQLGHTHGVTTFINTDTILDKRVSYYALSKSQFKDWLRTYSTDMVCINIALEHFYGPNDDESKFVTYIVKSILNEVDQIDLTPGDQQRDFIYISDVVKAFLKVLECGSTKAGFYSYEVGTNINTSIRVFAEMVKRLARNSKTKLNFGGLPYRDNEVMNSFVNTSAIRQLGWAPEVTLEDGLAETIRFEGEK